MPEINIQDINDAADERFGGAFQIRGVPGGDVTLLSPLRLSKEKRDKIVRLSTTRAKKATSRSGSPTKRAASSKAAEVNQDLKVFDQLTQIIEIAAATPDDGKRLIDYLDGDIARMTIIVEEWQKATQMGEASPSAS
jgi:hypothetical protein